MRKNINSVRHFTCCWRFNGERFFLFEWLGMLRYDLSQQTNISAQHKPRQQSVRGPALWLISLQQFVFSDAQCERVIPLRPPSRLGTSKTFHKFARLVFGRYIMQSISKQWSQHIFEARYRYRSNLTDDGSLKYAWRTWRISLSANGICKSTLLHQQINPTCPYKSAWSQAVSCRDTAVYDYYIVFARWFLTGLSVPAVSAIWILGWTCTAAVVSYTGPCAECDCVPGPFDSLYCADVQGFVRVFWNTWILAGRFLLFFLFSCS